MPLADELVSTEPERRALEALREATGETDGQMERHGVRCFLLMTHLAEKRGLEVDRELLLVASFLHDAGLYPRVSRGGTYTSDGAEFTNRLLAEFGWPEERRALCERTIERHHETRAQWDAGAEVELLRLVDRLEVSGGLLRGGLDRAAIREVFARVPRTGFYRALVKVVVPVVVDRPLATLRIFRIGS